MSKFSLFHPICSASTPPSAQLQNAEQDWCSHTSNVGPPSQSGNEPAPSLSFPDQENSGERVCFSHYLPILGVLWSAGPQPTTFYLQLQGRSSSQGCEGYVIFRRADLSSLLSSHHEHLYILLIVPLSLSHTRLRHLGPGKLRGQSKEAVMPGS